MRHLFTALLNKNANKVTIEWYQLPIESSENLERNDDDTGRIKKNVLTSSKVATWAEGKDCNYTIRDKHFRVKNK